MWRNRTREALAFWRLLIFAKSFMYALVWVIYFFLFLAGIVIVFKEGVRMLPVY